MDAGFWHKKWEEGDIAFHESAYHPMLVRFFPELSLGDGARVFVPLCGKTRDIEWLLRTDYHVVGAELSELAVTQLFEELGIEAEITETETGKRFSGTNIDIYVGDIFDLTTDQIGQIEAIYDRAAYVALPEVTRKRYAEFLCSATGAAPQLLITFLYDQAVMAGPPFSIPDAEVERLYGDDYQLAEVSSLDVPGGLKGKAPALEKTWLLRR